MRSCCAALSLVSLGGWLADAQPSDAAAMRGAPLAGGSSDCHDWPNTCPGVVPQGKQSWLMNASTIIMPCNNTGFTDPAVTKGWSIVDFDWSNGKGTGAADGWAKHKPMDDEELLYKQVQMTAAATKGTTVWVYRNTVYGYAWYTDVRLTLEDPAYAPWFFAFKPKGPWTSSKCDAAQPSLCSDLYHSQEQSPGFPHGDGDCAAPGCDCGDGVPCGFYIWNHSSTAVVKGQTFQQWFIHSYMLNTVGSSPLVSGFFWDDVWNPQCNIHDQVHNTCEDMGLTTADLTQLTKDYLKNMQALRAAVLAAGKFVWQMLWTGGSDSSIGSTCPKPQVQQASCAANLRALCNATSAAQTCDDVRLLARRLQQRQCHAAHVQARSCEFPADARPVQLPRPRLARLLAELRLPGRAQHRLWRAVRPVPGDRAQQRRLHARLLQVHRHDGLQRVEADNRDEVSVHVMYF